MTRTLQTYLKEIKKDILHIKKSADPTTQIGDLCSQSTKPIVFEKIKGFTDWNICDLLVRDRRTQAIALKTKPDNVVAKLAEKINQGPGKTRITTTGPVKEKILTGKKASFSTIPFCVHSPRDGGPYIGSGMCIVRDPDTGFQNVAMHRIHIKGKYHAAISLFSPHSNTILKKYAVQKKPVPMAVVIGHHPCFEIATNYSGPHDTWSEHELAATLLEETVEMVRCENSDILVPAHAEIVLECEIKPGAVEMEGPFCEFHNYYASEPALKPRLDINAITMRDNAIYRHLNATPYTDHQALVALPGEARLFDLLQRKGFQINDVFTPPWGGLFITIIQITGTVEEQVRDALMNALFNSTQLFTKTVIAVDDDIDIYDAQDILYALGTRVNPEKDIIQISGTTGIPYDLSLPNIPEAAPLRRGSKLAIDATKPPTAKKAHRDKFKRISTKGWGRVSLTDFIK
jgi:2,5-furandicarboxylate decarboxylase 1